MKWLALFLIATLCACTSPRPGSARFEAHQAKKQQHLTENTRKLRAGMRPHRVRKVLGVPTFADTRVFDTQSARPTVGQVWTYGDLHLTFDADGLGGDWRLRDWKWVMQQQTTEISGLSK